MKTEDQITVTQAQVEILAVKAQVEAVVGLTDVLREISEKLGQATEELASEIQRYEIIAEEGPDIWWRHKRRLTAEQMLDEELMLCALGTLDSFQSPFDALQAILDFHADALKASEGE